MWMLRSAPTSSHPTCSSFTSIIQSLLTPWFILTAHLRTAEISRFCRELYVTTRDLMRRSTCVVAKALPSIAFGRPLMVATSPLAFSASSNFPTMLTINRGICNNNIPRRGNKRQTRAQKGWGQVAYDKTKHSISPFERTIDEVCANIDTTLTPEQQTYVNMLKKKISGGAQSQKVRCKFYRSEFIYFFLWVETWWFCFLKVLNRGIC